MKTIVAGSREFNDRDAVFVAIKELGFVITELVTGECRGVDRLGEEWADANGIRKKEFPADWEKYKRPFGKNPAGAIRNRQMAEYADALIAVWDGVSPGTTSMINLARSHGLKIFIKQVPVVAPKKSAAAEQSRSRPRY